MEYDKLATLDNPYSSISELYRKIRTNIEYASLDKKIKIINVTSTVANETKTTTACNLAVMYANKFERTLLIDTDLRKPSVHQLFLLKNKIGLSDCMLDYAKNDYDLSKVDFMQYVQPVTNEGITNELHILTAGSKISNPAEFLGSNTFRNLLTSLKDYYDAIIIDSAPSGIIVDGVIVSRVSDATLYVIEHNRNAIETVKHTIDELKSAGANVIGSILTKTPVKLRFLNRYYYTEYGNYGNSRGANNE